MKALVLALALSAGATAQATPAVPFFGCKLKANVVEVQSSVELLVVRGETLIANGTSKCMDIVGQTTSQNVKVILQSTGLGPAFNGPVSDMTIYAVRTGITGVNNMQGTYSLTAGARLGLISSRVGASAGVQISGLGVGAGVEVSVENRLSLGFDLAGSTMTVIPTGAAVRTRY